jgi:hypothetical protein
VGWLLNGAATYLLTRGDPRAAGSLFERAHDLIRDRLGEDDRATLASGSHLAADLLAPATGVAAGGAPARAGVAPPMRGSNDPRTTRTHGRP